MAETVTIALEDGSTVEAEIVGAVPFQHPDETGGYDDVGVRSRAAAMGSAVTLTLEGVRDTVRSVGRWAAQTITEGGAAGSPDAFELQFGLKLASPPPISRSLTSSRSIKVCNSPRRIYGACSTKGISPWRSRTSVIT